MQELQKSKINSIIEELREELQLLPDNREKSIVVTKLDELEMWFEKIKVIELKDEDYDDFI